MKNEQNIIILADRGAWQTVKDWAHKPVRSLIEKTVGGYGEKMQVLREQDKQIQQWAKELKGTINGIRKGIKSNKFIDVAISLKELELKLNNMIGSGKIIQDVVESDLEKLDMEHDGDLDVFKESSMSHSLMSEAGWWEDKKTNWVHNKFLTKQRKERILALKKVLAVSEMTVGAVLQYVDQLKTARDRGNINNYLEVMQKVSNEQTKFLNTFTPIYEKYLKPLVDKALAEESSLLNKQKADELAKLEVQNEASSESEEGGTESPSAFEFPDLDEKPYRTVGDAAEMLGIIEPSDSSPEKSELEIYKDTLADLYKQKDDELKYLEIIKENESALEENDSVLETEGRIRNLNKQISDAEKMIKAHEGTPTVESVTVAHAMFIEKLYKVAQNNNKYDVAVMILKYAELVEEVDEDASLKLMAIAEGIIDA